MPMNITPEEAAEKYNRRMKAAVPDIQRGIMRVREAPGQKAAAKQDKMEQGIMEAIRSGKWAKRVASVPLEEWKRAAAEKGAQRIPAGVDAAMGKQEDFFSQLFPHIERGLSRIENMDDLTFEARLNRMVEFSRHMHGFKRE